MRPLIVNKCIEVNTKDLEMLPTSLKFVDHLISLVKRNVLFSTEIEEGLVALLKLLLVCSAHIFLVEIGGVTWKLKLLVKLGISLNWQV